ncbi:MAG: hypothetical protein AAFW70_10665 [Cyanobacteria bacterium J06635_10]
MENISLDLDNILPSLNFDTEESALIDAIERILPNVNNPNSLLGNLFNTYQDDIEQFLDLVPTTDSLDIGNDVLGTFVNSIIPEVTNEVSFLDNLLDITGVSSQNSIFDFITSRSNTVSTFDLEADLTNENSFYNLPYPNDLRLNADGSPDLRGFPIPDNNIFARSIKSIASDRSGFPTNSAGYFRFNSPVAQQDVDRVIAADTDSPILLIDIDPDSPNRGELLPTVASTFRPDLSYVPSSLLSVAPAPGIILNPNRTYAYVVKRSLNNANGSSLGVSPTLEKLINGDTLEGELGTEAQELYQPLWETLNNIEVNLDEVAAATVFTTGDVVSELAQLSDNILERYDVTIENLQLDPEDGASNPGFYELQGTVQMPQFQTGTPPFNTEGLFEFAPDGSLIEQRTEEIPVVITIPKTPMPDGGYPLVAYYHGSSGLSTQVVDRGPITEPGGEPTPALGPAFVVAEKGFAAVSSALVLNEERFPDNFANTYTNPLNLAAFRDTFRQTIIEQRLLLEALEDLKIPSEVIGSDGDVLLPTGETHFRFQSSPVMALGQSYGAQVANIISAVEPKIGAVVPTGSPSFFALQIIENDDLADLARLLSGTLQPLNPLYPALNLIGTAWEAVDPIVYMPRIAKRPLPGHPVRSIYQPVGQGDTIVSEAIFNANALASGVQQAGNILWPEMQESLVLSELDGIITYPVSNNLLSSNGTPYTGVVVQYEGDGITDPHNIFAQLDEVKEQYSSFFESFQETGVAVVPAP